MLREINRYQVREHIGKGSMADVYEAYDPKTDRLLAIKILREDRSDNYEYLERFFREAKAVGSLSHSNIVSIYDIDEMEKRPFIVMERLKGVPLSDLIKAGRKFTFTEIVTIGTQLALALDYAHSKGIVHRDIKPSNIIIISNSFKVKITDFGIAHFEDPEITMKTRMGDVLGTPQYMSPEQIQGTPVDGRADLFSVGVILYQLLTGERPFTGDTIPTLMYKITTLDPKPMNLGPEIPKAIRYVVTKLLSKDPADRYQTGVELAEALKQALLKKNKEPSAEPIKQTGISSSPFPKRRWFLQTAMVASLVAVAFGIFTLFGTVTHSPPDTGRIYGMVQSGQLAHSTVNVYAFESAIENNFDLALAEKLDKIKTNENGVFVLPLNIESKPILLTATTPEKSKQLMAVFNYTEGKEMGVNITMFSHMATALAMYLSENNEGPAAVARANSALSDFMQIENILVSKASEVNATSANNPKDNDRFSIIQLATVNLLARMNNTSSESKNIIKFSDMAFQDIRFDGALNGVAQSGTLHFGARAFSPKKFREELAGSIMDFGRAFNNEFALNDYYKIALLVNNSNVEIFPTQPSKFKDSPARKLLARQQGRIEAIRRKFNNELARTSGNKNTTPVKTAPRKMAAAPEPKPRVQPAAPSRQKPSNAKTIVISGMANIGGFLKNATIRVASLSDTKPNSKILGTTKTDSDGEYSLDIDVSGQETIFIAAYGGRYKEIMTGQSVRVPSDQLVLSSILNLKKQNEALVNLTYFTHVAAGLAQYLMKKGYSPKKAQSTAYKRMQSTIGFQFMKTTPSSKFTDDEHNGLITPELAYGMFNAAISNLTLDMGHAIEAQPHKKYTSAKFSSMSFQDISHDGVLNGKSASGQIKFAQARVDTHFYRRSIAQSILAVAQSNLNHTSLKFNQFFSIAANYNDSTDNMFGNITPSRLDSEGALITKLKPAKESMLSGDVNINALVNDPIGVDKVSFWLGKTYLGKANNPLRPSLTFNSKRFPSGIHKLKIKVVNKNGKQSTLAHYIYVNNRVKRKSRVSKN